MCCDPDGYEEGRNTRKIITLKNSQTFEKHEKCTFKA